MVMRVSSKTVPTSEALLVLLTIALGLALCFFVAHNVHFITLTSHPSHVLGLIWGFQGPIVILLYSRYRKDQERCSYWKAVGRGVLGLPGGAVVMHSERLHWEHLLASIFSTAGIEGPFFRTTSPQLGESVC